MFTPVIEKPKTASKPKQRLCPRYKVIMHNDNITTGSFVTGVLQLIFNKSPDDAYTLMMQIHIEEQAIVGIYALEHAELKRDQVHSTARANGYPLTCSIEPDE